MNFSRLTAAMKQYFVPGEQRRRLLMALFGVALCSISVAFFRQSAFGTDPFQCMCNGIARVFPYGFGTIYTVICAILLVALLLVDRHYLGIATLINLFLLGYFAEFCEWLLVSVAGTPDLPMRIAFLIIGIVILCIASALYFTADLGVSTYDFIALHLAKIQKKVPFRFVRIGTDLFCVLTGFVLGYMPGIGTLVTAFFMGPLISYFNHKIAEPLRYGRKKTA